MLDKLDGLGVADQWMCDGRQAALEETLVKVSC